MDRRLFLSAMLAACAAPAIVRASSIMRVKAPPLHEYLCEDSLERAIVEISKVVDESGKRIAIRPTNIWVPRETYEDAAIYGFGALTMSLIAEHPSSDIMLVDVKRIDPNDMFDSLTRS